MAVRGFLIVSILYLCTTAVFLQNPVDLSYQIMEELQAGSPIGNIAEDAGLHTMYDATIFQQLRYTFLNTDNPDNRYFALNEYRGIISTARVIDRDSLQQCQPLHSCYLNVQVAVSPAEYFQVIRIRVEIQDLNDNTPMFPSSTFTVDIPESVLINTTFLVHAAIDLDSTKYGIQAYQVSPKNDHFHVGLITNIDGSEDIGITVKKKLDREIQDSYQMKLIAKDGGIPPLTGTTMVTIQVTDINDHTPSFENKTYNVQVEENIPVNSTIIQVQATDGDSGLNGELFYYINTRAHWMVKTLFGINNKTGEIYTLKELDHEDGAQYKIPVLVQDHGRPAKLDATIIRVNVLDLNDNHPEIIINTLSSAQQITVSENSGNGTVVVPVKLFDKDGGDNGKVTCRLSSSKFALQHMYDNQYKIVVNERLDYEKKRKHNVTLWCEDNGRPKLTSMKRIIVYVRDENDHAPQFAETMYYLLMLENNKIGDVVGEVKATDRDIGTNGQVFHSLSSHSDASHFHINRVSGLITAKTVFDREQKDEYIFYVVAVDNSQNAKTNTVTVVVSILDQNDEAPKFLQNNYPFVILENQSKLTIVGQVNATDNDENENGQVSYQIDPKAKDEILLFAIRPDTGEIYTTKVVDREVKALHTFAIIARDKGTPALSSSAIVSVELRDVNDKSPHIDYPHAENDSITVSYQTPVGITVTQIVAFDDDIGENGRLTYFIHSGNSGQFFAVDPTSGDVIVKREMMMEDLGSHVITIGVHDNGKPQRKAYITANFDITNQPYVVNPSETQQGPHQNLIIVICLSSVSAILVVILIVAIIWMKRQNRETTVSYNCRVEASKAENKKSPLPASPSMTGTERNSHIEGWEDEEAGSSISTISRGDVHREKQPNGQVITTFPAQTETELYKMNYMQSKAAPGVTVLPSGDRTFSPTPANQHNDVQVNYLLGLLKKEPHDSDSACSVDISNPDSGRGSSDVDIHSRSSRQSSSQVICGDHQYGGGHGTKPGLQPTLHEYNDTHATQMRYSIGSASCIPTQYRQCPNQIKGHHRDSEHFPTVPSSDKHNGILIHKKPIYQICTNQKGGIVYSSCGASNTNLPEYNGIVKHCGSSNTNLPEYNGIVKHCGSSNTNLPESNGIVKCGRRQVSGTLIHDNSIYEMSDDSDSDGYSCGDIGDGGSTTSGEYTVDADGLVNEIDNLFFHHMVV